MKSREMEAHSGVPQRGDALPARLSVTLALGVTGGVQCGCSSGGELPLHELHLI